MRPCQLRWPEARIESDGEAELHGRSRPEGIGTMSKTRQSAHIARIRCRRRLRRAFATPHGNGLQAYPHERGLHSDAGDREPSCAV